MKQGHIKLSRKLFDGTNKMWEEKRTFSQFEAWVDLIQRAAWRPTVYSTRRYGTDELARGEFVASVRFLADRWGWSKSAVQRLLEVLKKAGQLAGQRAGHHGAIYCIANYESYQGTTSENGTASDTADGTVVGQSRDSRGTNKEAVKQLSSKSSKAGEEPWVTEGLVFWRANVGRVTPKRFREALAVLVTEWGWPTILAAMQEYIVAKKAAGKALRLEWFTEDAVRWIEESRQEIVDPETRWFTPKGQRWYNSLPAA